MKKPKQFKNEISIKPITIVEIEDTKLVSTDKLEKELDNTNLPDQFKKDLLQGYKKSNFFKSGQNE